MSDLYIGLMSGTSADGIDAAIVDFSQPCFPVIATHYTPYSTDLRKNILSLCEAGENEIHRLGELDIQLGKSFAEAVNNILKKEGISPTSIKAIGSHGQTIRHVPVGNSRFTLQIADPNIIAAETGITTVADFRRRDMAYGGQGAPLVPAFHQSILASDKFSRAIVNIGGIANITFLHQNNQKQISGYDTGPGNVLLDSWANLHIQKNHDENGAWGSQGNLQTDLLTVLLSDPYFQQTPPKSTGREYFNLAWLNQYLAAMPKKYSAIDVQTTLVELTAKTILAAIHQEFASGEILVCGGGAHNTFLMSRLSALATSAFTVDSTQKYGFNPDWMEAVAFAWLAKQTLNRKPGNIPEVTGAKRPTVLGGVYYV